LELKIQGQLGYRSKNIGTYGNTNAWASAVGQATRSSPDGSTMFLKDDSDSSTASKFAEYLHSNVPLQASKTACVLIDVAAAFADDLPALPRSD
jgi:hypothetical protein